MSTPPMAIDPEAPVLRGRDLVKSFRSGRIDTPVLRGLSLDVCPGELTLISGPSGCGKSTLLASLSGLQRPDAGEVEALGELLWSLDTRALERFRLHHTGFVFQGFNLVGALSAVEQVMLPLGALGLSRPEARERALEALDEVGLAARSGLRPGEMSGGEKQRVAIARALAKRPQLLFADEPTSALDAVNGQLVIDLLHRLARSHGAAVLCVSHDPRVVAHADRVLHMEDGRLLDDTRPGAAEGNT
ncbi:MAG: ABC transporter ATP-binding protein [Burkholderiaceae bacterium]|nr:ABC transporter ATP-binding protein [Burkholderiaceae bacterium]